MIAAEKVVGVVCSMVLPRFAWVASDAAESAASLTGACVATATERIGACVERKRVSTYVRRVELREIAKSMI